MNDPTKRPAGPGSDVTRLVHEIEGLLAADTRFDVADLNVRVVPRDGHIGLIGWVARLPEKIWIEQTAMDLAGPSDVESCLVVGPPGQRSDREIKKVVRDSLDQDRWIDATSIEVSVSQGVVRLNGIVDTTLVRRFAGALCWWVVGVRDVVNELSAIYPEPENDELLAGAIQAVMDKDPLVDVTEILVLSHGGVVTLTGTVGGEDARDAAGNDAWFVEGVRDVVNEIEVAPGGAAAGRIFGLDG